MMTRSPLWPGRRWLWGTCAVTALLGVYTGVVLLADSDGLSGSGFYRWLAQAASLRFYGALWLAAGLLVLAVLIAAPRAVPGVLMAYGGGQIVWAWAAGDYAAGHSGQGLVLAGFTAASAAVTWLAAVAVASVE